MTALRHAEAGATGPSAAARLAAFAAAALAWLVLAVASGPTHANQMIAPGQTLQIEVSKGQAIRLERPAAMIRLERPAAMVFVANPDVADYQIESPRMLYVHGRTVGETTLFAVDENDNVILNVNLEVNHNLSRLRRALADTIPGNEIRLRSVDGAVVLSGTVFSADASEDARRLAATFVPEETDVINNLAVASPTQVNLRVRVIESSRNDLRRLRVRVIESSRNDLRRLGINWDMVADVGNFVIGLSTGLPTTTPPAIPFLSTDRFAASGSSLVTRPGGANSLVGNFNDTSNFDISALIDALETEGLVRTLAEPNLTAVSGETASFLAGGEFPIIVPQDDGAFVVQFKEFGVSLTFTPTIIGSERISLKVLPEVSQLSDSGAVNFQGFSVPALTTRRAETTVELASGQSFAIAGLLQTTVNDNVSKVPWLGDVPVLGQLFRSEEFQRNETELVIVVTPMLVKPVGRSNANVALAQPGPGANVPPPSGAQPPADLQSAPGTDQDGPTLVGPAGFIVE